MTDNWPRISVVTVSFNQGQFIEATLRSVIEQGYPNLEYIVVDAGSTDGSVEIIRNYEKHLAWWCSEKDSGQVDGLNKGFSHATGKLFTYINSDDLLNPGSLERAAREFLAGHKWITSPCRLIEANKADALWPARSPTRSLPWFLNNPVPQPGTFWARELHEPFDGRFPKMFDYEFWMRLRFRKKVSPLIIDHALGTYRQHLGSFTARQMPAFMRDFAAIRREYLDVLAASERRKLKLATPILSLVGHAMSAHAQAAQEAQQRHRLAATMSVARSIFCWPPMVF